MIVVIAEKPSVAKDLARHLNANARHDGYFEGNGHQVTWAFGHLVRLSGPKSYQFDNQLSSLPILPDPFQLIGPDDQGARKQLKTISNLFQSCSEIIVATDAGREGELIFRYIYQFLKCQKPFQRLWISSLTSEAIAKGWKQLKPGADFDNLYHSARARSEADWLIGMNASIALTKAAGTDSVLSLGRVQTPVLSMICQRFEEHQKFKSTTYYTPEVLLQVDDTKVKIKWSGDTIYNQDEAQQINASIPSNITCTDFNISNTTEKPPLLFDLTTLQREANKRYGLTAKQTLEAAQKLYESKFLTYPRTDSRYITEDLFTTIPGLLTTLSQLPNISSLNIQLSLNDLPRKSVDDTKISDHHAILPTGLIPDSTGSSLDPKQRSVYDLVVLQTFAAFSTPCQKAKASATFSESFSYSLTQITEPGWRVYIDDQEKQDNQTITHFVKGSSYQVISAEITEGRTKPKPLFTDDTLLKAMETCGKNLDDEALVQALKGKGIGTPATRADTIELLIRRDYVQRKKKQLQPTELGIAIYSSVSQLPLASPTMTGEWESQLTDIAGGDLGYQSFIDKIHTFITSLVPELIDKAGQLTHLSGTELLCPKCQSHQLRKAKFSYLCVPDCGFKLSRTIAGHTLTNGQLQDLVTKQETSLIKGFKKNGGADTFSAHLVIKDDYSLAFKFPIYNKPLECSCPSCKSTSMQINPHKAFCSECDFQLWRTVAHKKLNDNQLIQLISKGATGRISGFKRKNGKGTFAAKLVLKDGQTQFA